MDIYLIFYAAGYLFSKAGYHGLSGLMLIFSACYLYWYDYRRTRNVIHLRGLFSLFWIGGQGISCFKLSGLQTQWSLITWLCFFLAWLGFWITFEFLTRMRGNPEEYHGRIPDFFGYEIAIYHCMTVITVLSVAAFIGEAVVLGFIPLFVKGMPHAYSSFHVTGVHYITVSCVLVPALSVLYFSIEKGRSTIRVAGAVIMNIIACMIPILCVSRFQLILAIGLGMITYIILETHINPFVIVAAGAMILPLYAILTVARGHEISYLNGIFEMKNSKMPIFITQPYMYIANNYDNFDCLVKELPLHTWGLRQLFPLWALTGLKFLLPSLVDFPIYVTKEELTTVTLFYDAYYDFGIFGVMFLSSVLGAVSYSLIKIIKRMRNPIGFLFYAQITVYLVLSFFTTWFSNPTTWFYLGITGMMYLYCKGKGYGKRY